MHIHCYEFVVMAQDCRPPFPPSVVLVAVRYCVLCRGGATAQSIPNTIACNRFVKSVSDQLCVHIMTLNKTPFRHIRKIRHNIW